MFGNKKRQQSALSQQTTESGEADHAEPGITLAERREWFQNRLRDCRDVVFQPVSDGHGRQCLLLYVEGIVDSDLLGEQVLSRLARQSTAEGFDLAGMLVSACRVLEHAEHGLHCVLDGEVLLIADGERRMVAYPFTKFEKRSIDQAQNEVVIRGSREAFIEDAKTNITMLRRRIKSPDLKLVDMRVGKHSGTDVVVIYMEGICKPELRDEVLERLRAIDIDSVLESSYIEEMIEDHPYSPFPQMQNTERPDTAAAALLEGRVVIVTDGTPIALIAPVTFPIFFQMAEDYYQRSYASTWIRWLRYTFMLVSMLAPSFYIALTTFHPEMIPSSLLFSIAAAREPVPFPAVFEALIMEVTFEALREASIRIPSAIGQAVSILGTLVIGEAAVRAGIVSSPMVIIVSLTGISSFIVPNYSLGLTLRLLRFPIMFLSASFGLLGLAIGIYLVMLHLVTLNSFGVPYMSPLVPFTGGDNKDTVMRVPWRNMRRRPGIFGIRAGVRVQKPKWQTGNERD